MSRHRCESAGRLLGPGDAFPSVRELSRELKINPNTAHKIVLQLVQEGVLEVHPGIGTLVAARAVHDKAARTRLGFDFLGGSLGDHRLAH